MGMLIIFYKVKWIADSVKTNSTLQLISVNVLMYKSYREREASTATLYNSAQGRPYSRPGIK